jgi:hypothetical protein
LVKGASDGKVGANAERNFVVLQAVIKTRRLDDKDTIRALDVRFQFGSGQLSE